MAFDVARFAHREGLDRIQLRRVSRELEDRQPRARIAWVQLILDVIASMTVGGGLDFRVPFIGMKLSVRPEFRSS